MKQIYAPVIIATILALALTMPGCGGSHKSSRSGGSSGYGGGSTGNGGGGTGTGSGTGSGSGSGTGGSPADAMPWDYEWGVVPTASRAWLEALADRVKGELTGAVWKATEGQMFFRNHVVKNLNGASPKSGSVVIENLDSGFVDPSTGMTGYHDANGIIHLAGKFSKHTFMHEFGHHFMKKYGEEYDCRNCNMCSGTGGKDYLYCDDKTCITSSTSMADCWGNFILPLYKNGFNGITRDWTHTGQPPSSPAPECTVTIEE